MYLTHLLQNIIDPSWNILLVTNSPGPYKNSTCVLSEIDYFDRKPEVAWFAYQAEKFNRNSWYKVTDLCRKKSWSKFSDKQFDIVICDHTLETTRDPIFVCEQMKRVGKRGYIETSNPIVEHISEIDRPNFVGYSTNRWYVDVIDDNIKFTYKNPLLQVMTEYHIIPPYIRNGKVANPLKVINAIFWEEDFKCYENKDMFEIPDWYFEDLIGDFKEVARNEHAIENFYKLDAPVPVFLKKGKSKHLFVQNHLVTLSDIKDNAEISISLFDQNGNRNQEIIDFEQSLIESKTET